MVTWRECKLGDLLAIKHGFAFKGEFFSREGEYVLLTPGNFREEGGLKLKGVKEKYYKGEFPDEFLLHRGDLLIAMTDLTQNAPILGSPAFVPDGGRFLHNQRLGKVINLQSDSVVPEFLFYLLNTESVRNQIKGSATGATVRHTSPSRIYDVSVKLPPLPVQRRIAGMLSAFDELIENSQRRIRILEAMARALHREWFVYLRFPGYEDHPRVASPLGEIPRGWEVKKLGDLISIDKGVSYNGAGLTEHGNPLVNLKNILAGGGFRRDATKPYSGDFKPRHTVKPGDIILANTDLTQAGNVVASAALIPRLADDRPILFSHHLFAVRLPEGLPASFIYHLLLEDDFRGFAKGYAIGTTVLGLPKEGVLGFTFALPSENLVADFAKHVAPIHQLVETLLERTEHLRQTRDLLLPRLLSRQIEVEAA